MQSNAAISLTTNRHYAYILPARYDQVVRVISKLVDRLEELGILIESERTAHVEDTQAPSDDRAWIVKELLESERKYVQDLEVMQNCSKALQQHDILPADRLHELFSNLNNLVDFQRRCLINIEDNARKPPDEQRFGRVFIMLESNFDVYSPFCSNYNNALDVIASEAHNIQRLRGMPAAEGCYLDPAYELPAFLIKPVQRICKYPLLLEQLLKKSDPSGPYYHELQEGLAIVQRGAAQVNEVRRRQEMHLLAADLGERVVDWRGHQLNTFGELHLCENFVVAKNDTEREYQVYLFQYILLCCKELVPAQPKKNSKSSSLLKQKTNSIGGPKKPKTMLQLKGRIFIKNVTDAVAEQIPLANGTMQQSLAVHWRVESEDGGPDVTESFSLYCKNDEQLRNWQTTLQKVIAEHPPDRSAANGALHSGPSSPVNMAGAGAGGRRNTGPSFSSFPQTPVSETGHPYPFARAGSQMSHHRMMFEDEDAMTEVMSNGSMTTGRGTPMGGARFSQPAEQRERQLSMQAGDGRPRARTEDQDSSVLSQWRSHSPAMPPPLPRQMSTSGAAAAAAVAAAASASQAEREHTLRKASSSRQLRQNGYLGGPLSITNTGGGYPRPPRQLADPMTPSTGGGEGVDSSFLPEQMERMHMGRHRGDSAAVAPAPHMLRTSSETGHTMARNRSASTSQMHLPPHLHAAHNPPPLPRSQPGSGFGAEQLHINTAASNGNNLLRQAAYGNGISAGGYVDKRYSGSSNSEVDSNHSGTSRPGSTAASSPLTMSGSSTGGSLPKGAALGGQVPVPQQRSGSLSSSAGTPAREGSPATMAASGGAAGNVVKVQVHYGGDTYVVVVLAHTSFASLLEKVAVKVRVCSGNKSVSEGTLRLKYVDEDGDRVSMNDDDDVQMAFDYSRATGEDVELYVM